MKAQKNNRYISLLIAVFIPVLALLVPRHWFGIEGLTIIQQRVIALFLFVALFWTLEPIPIFATSVVLITLELLLLSDSNFIGLRSTAPDYGVALSYREIIATFASPVIMLFLGGFFLAHAATKYQLDQAIAGSFLKFFGDKPKWVLLGLMCISAVFSMFMSNTATTAMMLSILVPVLSAFPPQDKARQAFVLGIPFAANLGGIGTPIGTPPNAIALKFIETPSLTFGKWMLFGVPLVIVMVAVAWALLVLLFPFTQKQINVSLKASFSRAPKAILVYVTFISTILLWLLDFVHGMNAYVVALVPVSIFVSTGVVNKEDLKQISWDVLWLVSGGIAIGLALDKSGLASKVMDALPLGNVAPLPLLMLFSLVGLIMSNFMSHTATANLVLPLLASLTIPVSQSSIMIEHPYLLLGTVMAISMGMSLPISSPPNALAYATGAISTRDMVKAGVGIGVIGYIFVTLLMLLLQNINFLA